MKIFSFVCLQNQAQTFILKRRKVRKKLYKQSEIKKYYESIKNIEVTDLAV